MFVIVDYGVGNLFSLKCSLAKINADVVFSGDKDVIAKADRILLPGVGAFEEAAKKLKTTGLGNVIIERAKKGVPLLGVCLGMQLLFERSFEFGVHEGLGLISGDVVPMEGIIPSDYKIPHIGWNKLEIVDNNSPIFKYINDGDHVYFVHSYFADTKNNVIAYTDYGAKITAAAANGNIFGCQFHPEKSGNVGLNILRAFCEY